MDENNGFMDGNNFSMDVDGIGGEMCSAEGGLEEQSIADIKVGPRAIMDVILIGGEINVHLG